MSPILGFIVILTFLCAAFIFNEISTEMSFSETALSKPALRQTGNILSEEKYSSSNVQSDDFDRAVCEKYDPSFTNDVDYLLKVTSEGKSCKFTEFMENAPDFDEEPPQSDITRCRPADPCVDAALLRRSRESWNEIFGESPESCDEGKRIVLRNFLSKEECTVYQKMHKSLVRDYPEAVYHAPGFPMAYHKVSMNRISNYSMNEICKINELTGMHADVSLRIQRVVEDYFLPRQKQHDHFMESDNTNVFTYLDARKRRKEKFLFPANVHADNCRPSRLYEEPLNEKLDTESFRTTFSTKESTLIACNRRTDVSCDFSTHSFPQRKITSILYLSDTIGLTDNQLKAADFRRSLRLQTRAKKGDHVKVTSFEALAKHKCGSTMSYNNAHTKAMPKLTGDTRLTQEQVDFLEAHDIASVGGGLCFARWEEADSANVASSPDLRSSIAECSRTGGRFHPEDGCCDPLLQTRCGDLVVFTSGGENPHAVMPTLTGQRLNIQSWWAPRRDPYVECGMTELSVIESIRDVCESRSVSTGVIDRTFFAGAGSCLHVEEVSCKILENGKRRCKYRNTAFDGTSSLCTKSAGTCITACAEKENCVAVHYVAEPSTLCPRGSGHGLCELMIVEKHSLKRWAVGFETQKDGANVKLCYSFTQIYKFGYHNGLRGP